MTVYIIDTCVIRELLVHFRREIPVFEKMWCELENMIINHEIVFVKESYSELERQLSINSVQIKWLKKFKSYFLPPTNDECSIVAKIYSYINFQNNICQKNMLEGRPVADAFIVAKAKSVGSDAIVVSREIKTLNAAKIPNICEAFEVQYMGDELFQKMLLA